MTTRPRRRVGLLALAIVLAFVATSCGGNEDAPSPVTSADEKPIVGGELTDLQNFSGAPPDHLDPNLAASVQDSQPAALIWDTLTETDAKTGELVNVVAESITHNEDFTEWTFKVKSGLVFSNGAKVLPSSFAFSWNRLLNPALASEVSYHVTDNLKIKGAAGVAAGTAKEMSGLKADDAAMTLTMTLEAPLNFADKIVSHLAFAPLDPKDVLKGRTDVAETVDYEKGLMVGNGPYMMAEAHKPNESVTLMRNRRYSGGAGKHAPYIDRIVFKEFSDQDTAFTAFESGGATPATSPRLVSRTPRHGTRGAFPTSRF